jgi:hypothetical protein
MKRIAPPPPDIHFVTGDFVAANRLKRNIDIYQGICSAVAGYHITGGWGEDHAEQRRQ